MLRKEDTMSQEELLTTWQIAGAREMLRNLSSALSPARTNLEPGLCRVLDAIENMDAAEKKPGLRNTLEINFSYNEQGSPESVHTILINGKRLVPHREGFVLYLDKMDVPMVLMKTYGGRLAYELNVGNQA